MSDEPVVENKILNYKFEDGKFSFSVDSNKDGEPSLKGSILLDEAIQEAFKKGEALEGVKAVKFDVSLGGLKCEVDSDKDGEKSLEIEVNFGEAIDEAFSKKDG